MKVNNRSPEQWREIKGVINCCEYLIAKLEKHQDELQKLMPELSSDVIADLANGLITLPELELHGTVSK